MQQSTFLTQLAIITLFCALAILVSSYLGFAALQAIAWASLAFFALLCLPMYYFSQRAMYSEDKFQFTNLFLVFTSTKMFAAIIIVLIYHKFAQPTSNHFLIPFFVIYLIYTIFEVYFLIQISKTEV